MEYIFCSFEVKQAKVDSSFTIHMHMSGRKKAPHGAIRVSWDHSGLSFQLCTISGYTQDTIKMLVFWKLHIMFAENNNEGKRIITLLEIYKTTLICKEHFVLSMFVTVKQSVILYRLSLTLESSRLFALFSSSIASLIFHITFKNCIVWLHLYVVWNNWIWLISVVNVHLFSWMTWL